MVGAALPRHCSSLASFRYWEISERIV